MIEPRLDRPDAKLPLLTRIGWMALIWAASVALLGGVALLIRMWIG